MFPKLKISIFSIVSLVSLSGCDDIDKEYLERAEITSRNIDLVQAAHGGDAQSMEQLIACIENAEPWPQKHIQVYYWLERLKLTGVETAEARQAEVEKMLSEEDKAFLDAWINELADTPMMPFVTEINCFGEN